LTTGVVLIDYIRGRQAGIGGWPADFRAIDMPPIIFNRDKTGGYVNGSAGWAGGMPRLGFIDGRWKIDALRQSIT